MAVQLRNALAHDLEIDAGLPMSLVFDYPTIGAMAEFLAMANNAPPLKKHDDASTHSTEENIPTDLTNMTDEEVEALLLERLKR